MNLLSAKEMQTCPQWNGSSFRKMNVYFDGALKPPYYEPGYLESIKFQLMAALPKKIVNGRVESLVNSIKIPFAVGATPFWQFGVENGFINTPYDPYGVLLYVIRDHYSEFVASVDGYTIESSEEFYEERTIFNNIWTRVKTTCVAGTSKSATEDVMIAIATKFFILINSADLSDGLIIDSKAGFYNAWCGKKKTIKIDSWFYQYKQKLDNVTVSALDWRSFTLRHLPKTEMDDFWLFTLPDSRDKVINHEIIDARSLIHKDQDSFFREDVLYIINNLFPELARNKARAALAVSLSNSMFYEILDVFRAYQVDGKYVTDHFNIYPDLVEDKGHSVCLFTNYEISIEEEYPLK